MARKKLRVASAKVSKMSILPRMVIAALVQLDIFIDWRMAVRAVGGSARCGATWGGPARLGAPREGGLALVVPWGTVLGQRDNPENNKPPYHPIFLTAIAEGGP